VTEPELRSAGPARGVLRASSPDGLIETLRVMPTTRLSPFVHHLWWVRWALHTPFEAAALAHPSAQIVFEVEDDVRRATIAGVRSRRFAMRRERTGEAFGITFRPAMFQPLLGASMTTITDRVIPLAHVVGAKANAWARTIHAEPDVARKVAIVDAFLEPLLLPADADIIRLRDLVERIARDRSIVRVERVAEIAGRDVRRLQRWFRRYVGVSPKWVIQRFRLHEAAEQLKARRPPTLAALAASLGYADQAHFARDFKLTVGQTPRAFEREWLARR
jgi:AraC-like DNA-binding protein